MVAVFCEILELGVLFIVWVREKGRVGRGS